jgi:equilibrative nucleoside transporter 1/2/3
LLLWYVNTIHSSPKSLLTFSLKQCLFPAITATIEPSSTKTDLLVFSALHFLVFNVADLAGRALTSIQILSPTNRTFLVTYSLSRTIFIPFFLACNVAGSPAPAIVTSDTVYMLGLLLFGLTHGHCSTLSLVVASEEGEGGRSAQLAQFWMMIGIVAGGGASFGVRALL